LLIGDLKELQRKQIVIVNQVIERAFERFRVISVFRLEMTAFGSCIVLLFERVFESFECQVRLGLCL